MSAPKSLYRAGGLSRWNSNVRYPPMGAHAKNQQSARRNERSAIVLRRAILKHPSLKRATALAHWRRRAPRRSVPDACEQSVRTALHCIVEASVTGTRYMASRRSRRPAARAEVSARGCSARSARVARCAARDVWEHAPERCAPRSRNLGRGKPICRLGAKLSGCGATAPRRRLTHRLAQCKEVTRTLACPTERSRMA